jgi:uncharacterized MAPEG superfamily protein
LEIFSIGFAGALVWVCALIQNLTHATRHGPEFVMSDRSQGASEDGFGGRAARTLRNHLESAVMYIPVAVGIVLLHAQSKLTYYTALVYVVARVLFTFFYWFGLNKARSTAWTVGMACIAVMFYQIIPA